MNPTPLPLTTVRIQVFNDNPPADATYEGGYGTGVLWLHRAPVRPLRHSRHRLLHQIPLYQVHAQGWVASGSPTPVSPNAPIAFDDGAKPVVDPNGRCLSDPTGQIVIPNMGPNRFAATVTPPVPAAGQTCQWVNTTTLECGHDHDIWSQEGGRFRHRELKDTQLVPSVQFGFVRTPAMRIPRTNVPTGGIIGSRGCGAAVKWSLRPDSWALERSRSRSWSTVRASQMRLRASPGSSEAAGPHEGRRRLDGTDRGASWRPQPPFSCPSCSPQPCRR
jgi:hypothetical protein